MAFKKISDHASVPASPDKLLLDLPRRKIPDVLPHQREIMRTYAAKGVDLPDVALQLPTGSGKTLVGLLIAEWRRRKYKERVVYLCPTRQLVNQAVEQGEEKYGLTALAFTGRIRDYSPAAKAAYQLAERVAVTTYSSLFNTNPFFESPDVVIIDDAHAAENYIASMWSIQVDRRKTEQSSLHTALCGAIRPYVDSTSYARIAGDVEERADRVWVDKLPGPTLSHLADELTEILDEHAESGGVSFGWSLLRDHLRACHMYMSMNTLLIRPLIPPTWNHPPFNNAKQRIYMSATLGAGGDLERLVGRRNITRLSTPEGWDRHGVGRRFFVFPSMSLDESAATELRDQMISRVDRSLILVPNDRSEAEIAQHISKELGIETVDATALENSKALFVGSAKAVAVVANRYDGIDFPGDECRLLFIEGMPTAVNLQERFLMSRMGANVLFNERVQTRVLQAVGRCTRSLEDYSAVVIGGEELSGYLADHRRRQFLHPELQAEIEFGVAQSKDVDIPGFLENLGIFLENGEQWEQVNRQIVAAREKASRQPFPAIDELAAVVEHEVRFQEALWQGDYEAAAGAADRVLGGLKASELRGYRALWNYLAGHACWLSAEAGSKALRTKSFSYFEEAKKAAVSLPWLVSLARYQAESVEATPVVSISVASQMERVEGELAQLGTLHDRRFSELEKRILNGLASTEKGPFQEAHMLLGRLLGFDAGSEESEGSPDSWWGVAGLWFVFEDHAAALSESALHVEKARQAASHPNWLRSRLGLAPVETIVPVVVTPVRAVKQAAVPHLTGVSVWPLSEFRSWAAKALSVVRQLRTTFLEPGDVAWRMTAVRAFEEAGLDAESVRIARAASDHAKHLTPVA